MSDTNTAAIDVEFEIGQAYEEIVAAQTRVRILKLERQRLAKQEGGTA